MRLSLLSSALTIQQPMHLANTPVIVRLQRYIAAIACLKKALYLGPFEWIISYNLGLVHLHTAQYASAFHYFSSSINLKPDFAHSYMYLAVTLGRLDDFENACAAHEKAIQMAGAPGEPVFHLNYGGCITDHEGAWPAGMQPLHCA